MDEKRKEGRKGTEGNVKGESNVKNGIRFSAVLIRHKLILFPSMN